MFNVFLCLSAVKPLIEQTLSGLSGCGLWGVKIADPRQSAIDCLIIDVSCLKRENAYKMFPSLQGCYVSGLVR